MPVDTKFIACIFESDDLVEIRILPRGTRYFIKAQKLHTCSQVLDQANSEGQHIYFGANPRKREGSKAEDVAIARCLFADFDNIDPKDAVAIIEAKGFPDPTCTLDSGHGLHAWWRLDETIHDLKTWTQYQKQLIAILHSDKSIHDSPRIMRFPGFVNHKTPKADCRLLEADSTRKYTLEQIIATNNSSHGDPAQLSDMEHQCLRWALDRAEPGNRNDTGMHLACHLRDNGIDKARAEEVLRVYAGHQDNDYTETEAINSVRSVYTRDPRASGRPPRIPQAEQLVQIALDKYRIGQTETDDVFAVKRNAPNIALMFRGSSDALRSSLAKAYRDIHHRTPSTKALTDAITNLQGEALDASPEQVSLRVAKYKDGIVIDLGDPSGRAVVVMPGKWEMVDRSPVIFRRTPLTAPLPEPRNIEGQCDLRALLNVTDESWPLVWGWMVAAFMPWIPHPILMLGGEQGTGKTTAAWMVSNVVDPSPGGAVVSMPKGEEQWAVTAKNSWVVSVDNVSGISNWWSDALCRGVTGDAWVCRKLYTNGEVSVLQFKRCIILTSIDAGALRGDLGERVLMVELERIEGSHRMSERQLNKQYQEAHPHIFASILDELAKVLTRLPEMNLSEKPRMADFAEVLAALDDVDDVDNRFLYLYQTQGRVIAGDVAEDSDVGAELIKMVHAHTRWEGTAGELLETITPDKPGKTWPKTARALAAEMKRLTPALREIGVEVSRLREKTSARRRLFIIERKEDPNRPNRPIVHNPTGNGQNPNSKWTIADDQEAIPDNPSDF